jgi:hypothetical protein
MYKDISHDSVVVREGVSTYHKDINLTLSSVYDDVFIALREAGSNGFNRGKANTVNFEYDGSTITCSDDGIGFTSHTKQYFLGQNVGERNPKDKGFNMWRIGMLSFFQLADVFHIFSKSEFSGEEIFVTRNSDGRYFEKQTPQKRESHGTTIIIELKNNYKKTQLSEIEDMLKKYFYWQIVEENKKVTLNGKQISIFNGDGKITYGKYGFGNIIDGLECEEILPISGVSIGKDKITGHVFLGVKDDKIPSWMPLNKHLRTHMFGDFLNDNVIDFGDLHLFLIANNESQRLRKSFNAGKTTLKGIKNTAYFKKLQAYVQKWKPNTQLDDSQKKRSFMENFMNIFEINIVAPPPPPPPSPPNPFPKEPINTNNSLFPPTPPNPTPKGIPDFVEVSDPSSPFMRGIKNGSNIEIIVNCKEGNPRPNISSRWNSFIQKTTTEQWDKSIFMPMLSRVASDLVETNKDQENSDMYIKKYILDDNLLENALTNIKNTSQPL